MERVIRWGILGTGKIARAFAAALADTPGAELAAVASRSAAGAADFGARFGAARCHGSYQALAEDAQLDVIYIATPHAMHYENAMLCLRGGKAILVEKAFTLNQRQAAEVFALAREKQLFAMEAMWSRFMPAMLEARRIVASGEIGVPTQLSADFGFVADVGPGHRLLNPELGGGALLDLGVYPLSMASYFLGPVAAVQAFSQLGATGVDLQTGFMLRHRDGALSTCSCSLLARSPTELTISGSRGFVRLHDRFHNSEEVSVTLVDGAARTTRTLRLPRLGNGYAHEAIEVGRCLRAGLLESPLMPHDESEALMGVLDTIRAQVGLHYSADQQH